MKFKILAFIISLLLLFSVTAVAATPAQCNIELSFSEEYLVITQENISEYSELIDKLGYTQKSFKALFTDSSLVAFILHSQSKSQIQIRAYSTKFSQQTEDIGLLSQENRTAVAKQLVPEYSKIISVNDAYFICSKTNVKDDTGEYSSSQYVTLKNGMLYTATVYNRDAQSVIEDEILNSFSIKTQKQSSGVTYVVSVILVLIFILVFLALAVYIIILLIVQLRRREDNDVREFVRIKRRRF